jgi:hypothetical protein
VPEPAQVSQKLDRQAVDHEQDAADRPWKKTVIGELLAMITDHPITKKAYLSRKAAPCGR